MPLNTHQLAEKSPLMLAETETEVIIEISDSGDGIAKDDLEFYF